MFTRAINACKDIHLAVLKNNDPTMGPHNILPKIEEETHLHISSLCSDDQFGVFWIL